MGEKEREIRDLIYGIKGHIRNDSYIVNLFEQKILAPQWSLLSYEFVKVIDGLMWKR